VSLPEREIYRQRFQGEAKFRQMLWSILCEHWFQRWVTEDATVLEIAAGHCEFINSIRAGKKLAVDINPDTVSHANEDVEVIITSSTELDGIDSESVDVVFVSNFFEHISKDDIVATVEQAKRVLRRGGQILILQPNIRFTARDYWMFFDHVTPVDDRALREMLDVLGFETTVQLPKFLPYTTKSRYPRAPFLIRAYLRMPFLFRFFGGQAFLVAKKP
jgi:SAM-dependent methyltransferase